MQRPNPGGPGGRPPQNQRPPIGPGPVVPPRPQPTPPRPQPIPPRPQPTPPRPQPPRPTPPPAPPPRPMPPQSCPSGYRRINVGVGVDFAALLTRYNVSYGAMVAANPGRNPQNVLPGQQFCVPPSGTRAPCLLQNTYTLRQGESLNTLPRLLQTSTLSLLRANPSLAPSDFVPGMTICRP